MYYFSESEIREIQYYDDDNSNNNTRVHNASNPFIQYACEPLQKQFLKG